MTTDQENECEHCWHFQNVQPLVYIKGCFQSYEYCCHCGQTRIRTTEEIDIKKHGRYLK